MGNFHPQRQGFPSYSIQNPVNADFLQILSLFLAACPILVVLASVSYDVTRLYGINVRGPGGSTRRLHHFDFKHQEATSVARQKVGALDQDGGAETGSTRVVKVCGDVRHCIRRYRANIINANDNVAFVAANDNSVVAGDVRKAA